MKCLIIAAGQGTRLRALAPSKPLAEVGGRPLIEHVIRSAKAGGASEFVVVSGYEAEPLDAFLADLARRLAVPLEIVRNPEWERPNGLSVLAAAERLPGSFVLLMSDHLFDPRILSGLLEAGAPVDGLTLAADYDIANPRLDIDDATKLQVSEEGRIEGIGKLLTDYNAIDTGIFLATPALLAALRASLAEGGSGSLSEGVQALARAGSAMVHDIGNGWWLDVDDEAAFAKAEESFARQSASPST
ncbi:MAG TPA: NTP transferase domain-containing protein [Allosphingosinicella sp.]